MYIRLVVGRGRCGEVIGREREVKKGMDRDGVRTREWCRVCWWGGVGGCVSVCVRVCVRVRVCLCACSCLFVCARASSSLRVCWRLLVFICLFSPSPLPVCLSLSLLPFSCFPHPVFLIVCDYMTPLLPPTVIPSNPL